MRTKQNVIGEKYGRMLVIKELDGIRYGKKIDRVVLCKCDCSNEKVVRLGNLRSGNVQSCGCITIENRKSERTHGMTGTKEYKAWQSIHQRCFNENDCNYKYYGARGIGVCERWMSSVNFLEDMGRCPSKTHSIERRDNDENYCPENCKWATKKEQANNRRNTRSLEFKGVTMSVSEWAGFLELKVSTLFSRLDKGWSTHKALTTKTILT